MMKKNASKKRSAATAAEVQPVDLMGWKTLSSISNPETGEQAHVAEGYVHGILETWEACIAIVSAKGDATAAHPIFVRERDGIRDLTLGLYGTDQQQIERLLAADFGLPGIMLSE